MKFGDIIQNAQSVLRPDAHVVIVSRDISLTSSLAITGVGFAPSSVICFASKSLTDITFSIGAASKNDGGAIEQKSIGLLTISQWDVQNSLTYHIAGSSSTRNIGTVSSFDSDGITMAWSKNGSPTGTWFMNMMFFK